MMNRRATRPTFGALVRQTWRNLVMDRPALNQQSAAPSQLLTLDLLNSHPILTQTHPRASVSLSDFYETIKIYLFIAQILIV